MFDAPGEFAAGARQPPYEQLIGIDGGERLISAPHRGPEVTSALLTGQHLLGDPVDVGVDVVLRCPVASTWKGNAVAPGPALVTQANKAAAEVLARAPIQRVHATATENQRGGRL